MVVDPDTAELELDRLYLQATVQRVRALHRVQETAPELVLAAIRQLLDRRADAPAARGK